MIPEPSETLSRTILILLPEIVLALSAVAIMTLGVFTRQSRGTWAVIAAFALIGSFIALLGVAGLDTDAYAYGSVALNDSLALYARFAFLATGLILLALAHDQVADERSAEFLGGLLLVIAGSMIVATANDLIFLFVGLELVSIPTYLLLYLPRREAEAQEAATKYFYLSVFSAALLLFGLAYLYGMTGVSNLKAMSFILQSGASTISPDNLSIGLIAVIFVVAGLGFRVAAVPFHFYAPDVYQGAPTIVTALLAWIPKGIGFVAMLRCLTAVVSVSSELLASRAVVIAWIIAAATMILGNTVALSQTNLKRLFAYSSIAHAGYLMVGIAAAFNYTSISNYVDPYSGGEGVLFYLAAYSLMTLGAFAVIIALDGAGCAAETIDDLSGLSRTRPLLSLAMAVCLLSLAGVPPLAGFWGKFFVFASAWNADTTIPGVPSLKLLAVIGGLNAAVGAYYYLRIVAAMYYGTPSEALASNRTRPTWPAAAAVASCAVLSLVVGLIPGPVLDASHRSAVSAMYHPDPLPYDPSDEPSIEEPEPDRELRRPVAAARR